MPPSAPTEFDAGRVDLRLALADGRVAAVDIAVRRPCLTPLLRGKPAEAAVRLVPLLYSLCGGAQGRAATLALAAARGAAHAPAIDPASATETLREHLWRLLLDLPPLLGQAPRREAFLAAWRALAGGDRAGLDSLLTHAALEEMIAALPAPEARPDACVALLPPLDARASLAVWPRLTEDFARTPLWRGAPAETGAFARLDGAPPGTPFQARWRARLAELRAWTNGTADMDAKDKLGAGGTASAAPAGPQIGRALVETARGLLMHEIALDGERVADYIIVAPTEWNFHPRGRLAAWLAGAPAEDPAALRHRVALAVAALDPCVRWELGIDARD